MTMTWLLSIRKPRLNALEGGPRKVSSLCPRSSSLPLSHSCVIVPTNSPSASRPSAGLSLDGFPCVRLELMRDHGIHLIETLFQ